MGQDGPLIRFLFTVQSSYNRKSVFALIFSMQSKVISFPFFFNRIKHNTIQNREKHHTRITIIEHKTRIYRNCCAYILGAATILTMKKRSTIIIEILIYPNAIKISNFATNMLHIPSVIVQLTSATIGFFFLLEWFPKHLPVKLMQHRNEVRKYKNMDFNFIRNWEKEVQTGAIYYFLRISKLI